MVVSVDSRAQSMHWIAERRSKSLRYVLFAGQDFLCFEACDFGKVIFCLAELSKNTLRKIQKRILEALLELLVEGFRSEIRVVRIRCQSKVQFSGSLGEELN